jgi:hypothetical protein
MLVLTLLVLLVAATARKPADAEETEEVTAADFEHQLRALNARTPRRGALPEAFFLPTDDGCGAGRSGPRTK